MAVLHIYVELTVTGEDAAGRYPGVAAHLAACGPCDEDFTGLLPASPVGSAADERGDREVLAFDLYGTLVDPIAIPSELDQVLGESDGREAARLWRLKQLEYSFRLTAMERYEDFQWVTSRALEFALAALGVTLPGGQSQRLVELYDHLQPFPDAVPALRALAARGMSSRCCPTAAPP